jgi:hypothetical protein
VNEAEQELRQGAERDALAAEASAREAYGAAQERAEWQAPKARG